MLDKEFYQSGDVVAMARALLGKVLHTSVGGVNTAGVISETEAYHQDERACHAYQGKLTQRTEMLFREGGLAYVYLCYGIHHLFNVVTGPEGVAQAVLIRAVIPYSGREHMMRRRNMSSLNPNLSSGPGTLTRALGITTAWNGYGLQGPEIWLEDAGIDIDGEMVSVGTRIGVDYAGSDALLPWRFNLDPVLIKENHMV